MAWTLPTGERIVPLNGTTPVTLVAAPTGTAKRMITSCRIENLDSIPHIVAFQRDVAGVKTDIKRKTVAAGSQLEMEAPYDLVATDQSLMAVLGEAISGAQPKAFVAFVEVSS